VIWDHAQEIEEYLRQFESFLVGSAAEKAEWTAELRAHLQEAAQAGDLTGALDRLGPPFDTAVAFRAGRPLVAAARSKRWQAMIIDHVPLIILVIAIAAQEIIRGNHIYLAVPPTVTISSVYPATQNIGVPIALAWSWLGLALIETLTGRTPGKALIGLRTVSTEGPVLTVRQAILRRVPILFGPLAWLDWLFGLYVQERHQRLLELFAKTMVIEDPRSGRPLLARRSLTFG